MRAARSLLIAVAAGAVLLAAGCSSSGGGDPLKERSADQILKQSQESLRQVESVHILGDVTSAGEHMALDLSLKKGGAAKGSIETSGATIELVRMTDAVYLKADADSWKALTGGDQVGTLLAGKWLKVPNDSPAAAGEFNGLDAFADLDTFADQLGLDSGEKVTRKPGTTTVNGQRAIELDLTGAEEGGTMFVADTSDALPLRLVPGTSSSTKGQIDFTEYGKKVDVQAPGDAVDVSSVIGGAG